MKRNVYKRIYLRLRNLQRKHPYIFYLINQSTILLSNLINYSTGHPLAAQNVEIRRRAKSPSDFILGGYVVAMWIGVLDPRNPIVVDSGAFYLYCPTGCNPTSMSGENIYNTCF